jgi:hypothetical protein
MRPGDRPKLETRTGYQAGHKGWPQGPVPEPGAQPGLPVIGAGKIQPGPGLDLNKGGERPR